MVAIIVLWAVMIIVRYKGNNIRLLKRMLPISDNKISTALLMAV